MDLEQRAEHILASFVEDVEKRMAMNQEIPQSDIRLVAQILREVRGLKIDPKESAKTSYLDIEEELRKKLEDEWEPSG